MKLVIVESPTKAKTIQKFLGKKFSVMSSYGHIRDLPKSKMGIDIENDFAPQYVVPLKAKKNLTALKLKAKKADMVILATDEDREGEAIAWHLKEALGLTNENSQRIAFHEITDEAIAEALEHPRTIDERMVDSQQARRMLDRLVGYELSPFLWRKIYRGLSAGRVQSVAVRMVVEREREIRAFNAEEYWTIEADFTVPTGTITAALFTRNGERLDKFALPGISAADAIVADLEKASYKIADVNGREAKKTPPPPFTTSILQQEASRRLNMSPKQTMMVAQQLYEGVTIGDEGAVGLITYMRTDSMNLSEKFLTEAQTYLLETYGKEYATEPRRFKSRSKNAQEAHEAIRPSSALRTPESVAEYLDPKQKKLYELIWRRAIASQMPEAIVRTTTIDVATVQAPDYTLRASGSVLSFDGWRKVYYNDANDVDLPDVTVGATAMLQKVGGTQHFTEPPARFSDATLIKSLEEHGIGRPSTYAPTISTITDRGYVEKKERRLYPTELAELVNDLLVEHFPEIIDFEFTATLERELDEIAEGEKQLVPVLRAFYTPFKEHLIVKDAEISKESITQEASDQVCATCGKPMVVKFGRFGRFLACTGYPECRTTKPLAGSDEAVAAETFAAEPCELCGKPMAVKRGRFGTFLGCTGYPECKKIKPIVKSTGVPCPGCGKGDLVEKRSKRGRNFFACNTYPACSFALWSKPTGEKCPTCGSLLVFAAKGAVRCSMKGCGYIGMQSET
ncbi:MAG: type I DNA topoisomerase [Patescibacteria group bacterium]|jgi:DNA topoisomerase-1